MRGEGFDDAAGLGMSFRVPRSTDDWVEQSGRAEVTANGTVEMIWECGLEDGGR